MKYLIHLPNFSMDRKDVLNPKPPVGNTQFAINGGYAQLGILAGRLFNLGESEAKMIAVFRTAIAQAKHDGVGQEG